ncbi:saposin A-type domain protein [Opisthorchis viverrini]|uniref:Saposin A-type domain protein n=1 Tax=Opisthorchis viverrini TaxID=6198 RepID=A0A1S8WKG7_OPIVI|nr:saposin A-type domain protein [Opisthorchis viverrini]
MIYPVQPVGDTYCDTCKLLVTMIEHQLVQNETEDQVKELLKSLCNVLPSSYTEECISLVDRYLPFVMDYLTRKVKPEEVCKAIQLCPSVGRSPCLRGPVYWCSSRAAERRCEATGMDEICGNPELVLECGKSSECLNRQMVQYLKLVSQHTHEALQYPQPIQNCTVCAQLVARLQLHKTLFGASVVDKDTCVTYAEQADRDQCKLVLDNHSEIFRLLAQKATDTEAVCKSLALCQMKIQDSGVSGRVVEDLPENVGAQVLACSEGPVFWCSSKRNAEACGTVNFCNALSWFGEKETKPKPTTLLEVDVDIFGVNACAWGSVYWCQSEETARRCGALDHCRTVVWRSAHSGPKLQIQQVKLHHPSNPCLWGPGYYCSSPEKALECGQHYIEHCWQIAMRRSHS